MTSVPVGACLVAVGLGACTQGGFKTYVAESNFSGREFATRTTPLPSCRDTLFLRSWVSEATQAAHCGPDWINYDTPAPDIYEFSNEFFSNDSMSVYIQDFSLRNGDSILVSKAYPPRAKWFHLSGQIYCNLEACRWRLDTRDSVFNCKTDSVFSLSTSGAFRLPVVDRILLREHLRVGNRLCDTLLTVEETMNFQRWGGRRLKFEHEGCEFRRRWWR